MDVAVQLHRDGGWGWNCNCGSISIALLRGTTMDYTVQCGCGATYRALLEQITPAVKS